MENETWMNARKAKEYGFCDEILYEGKDEQEKEPADEEEPIIEAQLYSSKRMGLAILNRLGVKDKPPDSEPPKTVIGLDGKTEDGAVPYQILRQQLDFLK